MTKQAILKKTMQDISRLPEWRIREVSDFVEFLLQKMKRRNWLMSFKATHPNLNLFIFWRKRKSCIMMKI